MADMETITAKCFNCGKSVEILASENIHIPKVRCDACLKKR